jgi:cell shape-determining protein MreC
LDQSKARVAELQLELREFESLCDQLNDQFSTTSQINEDQTRLNLKKQEIQQKKRELEEM